MPGISFEEPAVTRLCISRRCRGDLRQVVFAFCPPGAGGTGLKTGCMIASKRIAYIDSVYLEMTSQSEIFELAKYARGDMPGSNQGRQVENGCFRKGLIYPTITGDCHAMIKGSVMQKYKNILLVYPEVPDNTYWSYKYALKFINKKSSMPPLGLVSVAALFPREYDLKLVDLNISRLKETDIAWADAVFISAMLVQKESMAYIVERCRSLNKIIVAGGPYVTNSHEEIRGVDHLLLGEVDQTFSAFLHDLNNGTAKRVYPMPDRPDISTLPVPRFDLLDMNAYGSMAVQYSRGCPFHCEFCDIWTVYGNRPRLKNAETLVSEIDTLYRLGHTGAVFVVDDNFIGNKGRVKKELLPALKRWQEAHGYPFHFFTEASINLAEDEALLTGMREAGFNEVFIGIETPSKEGLAETGKSQNLKVDMEVAVRTIQKHGIEVLAGFIIGFDNDPPDIFERQIEFIQKNAIPKAMIGLLTALPGTRLFQRMKDEGRLVSAPHGNNTHSMSTNFKTIMNPEDVREGYKTILDFLYDWRLKNYFARCTNLLDNIEHRDFYPRKIRFSEVKIFSKAFFRQIFTPYGFQYLKYIIRNLFKNRDLFAEAVTLSVCGHHFHKITRQTLKKEKVESLLDEKNRYFSELVSRYSSALEKNSEKRLKYISRLWKKRIRLLTQMQAKINKLNIEFRTDLNRKYIEISSQMRDQMARFETNAFMMNDSAKN